MAKRRIQTPPSPSPPANTPTKIQSLIHLITRPVKLPGWFLVLLACFNGIPDYDSRIKFWLDNGRDLARWMVTLTTWLGSPVLTVTLVTCGMLYLLFVGEPEKRERRNIAYPVIGWALVGVAALFFITVWSLLLTFPSQPSAPRLDVIRLNLLHTPPPITLLLQAGIENSGDAPLTFLATRQFALFSDHILSVEEEKEKATPLLESILSDTDPINKEIAPHATFGISVPLDSNLKQPLSEVAKARHLFAYSFEMLLYKVKDTAYVRKTCLFLTVAPIDLLAYCQSQNATYKVERLLKGGYRIAH